MAPAFVHDVRAPRVVFGAGAPERIPDELDRACAARGLLICTAGRGEAVERAVESPAPNPRPCGADDARSILRDRLVRAPAVRHPPHPPERRGSMSIQGIRSAGPAGPGFGAPGEAA